MNSSEQLYVCQDGFYPILFQTKEDAEIKFDRIAATFEAAAIKLSQEWSIHTKTKVTYVKPGEVLFFLNEAKKFGDNNYILWNIIAGERIGWIVLLKTQDISYPSILPLFKDLK